MVWIVMRFWRSVTPAISLFSQISDLNTHNKSNLTIARRMCGAARLRVSPWGTYVSGPRGSGTFAEERGQGEEGEHR